MGILYCCGSQDEQDLLHGRKITKGFISIPQIKKEKQPSSKDCLSSHLPQTHTSRQGRSLLWTSLCLSWFQGKTRRWCYIRQLGWVSSHLFWRLTVEMPPSALVFRISFIVNGEKQVLGESARISRCRNDTGYMSGSNAGSKLRTSQVGWGEPRL